MVRHRAGVHSSGLGELFDAATLLIRFCDTVGEKKKCHDMRFAGKGKLDHFLDNRLSVLLIGCRRRVNHADTTILRNNLKKI